MIRFFALRLLLACLLLLGLRLPSSAQFSPAELVQARLIPAQAGIEAGQPFTVGVYMKLKPGWHTYWAFPGEAGAAPRLKWTLPEGFTAGPIQYPIPHRLYDAEAEVTTYVYEDEVLLPVTITAPAQLPAGPVQLKAVLTWFVCEKTCIRGESELEASVTPGSVGTPLEPALWAKWRAQMPQENATAAAQWEIGEKEVRVTVRDLPRDAKVDLFPLPPEEVAPGNMSGGEPQADGARVFTIPVDAATPAGAQWRALLAVEKPGAARTGTWLETTAGTATTPAPANATSQPAATTSSPVAPAPAPRPVSLLVTLGLAFLGGLILNVMPCVLPVIALKIFSFVKQAGEEPGRVFRLGLAFVAGVFVFFTGLALAAVLLKSAGSSLSFGYPLQNPYLLSGLVAVVFLFGLNLVGLFEITLGSGTTSTLSKLSARQGYGGAFAHGLFTTLLGTSCTAPFLASALGATLTQPPVEVFLTFLAVAAGMSLPYLLLTARPQWLKFVPKPGVWMDRVKQGLGFIMLAVAVWLLTVFAENFSGATGSLLWLLFALAIAGWIFGVWENRTAALVVALLLAALAYGFILRPGIHAELAQPAQGTVVGATQPGGIPWQKFSAEALAQARTTGKPVFVDFTANWCLNCKVYERTVIETDSMRADFAKHGVIPLKADWSRNDPTITKALNDYGRIGVPLYVIYRPGAQEPILMDGVTAESLRSALELR